MRLSDLPTLNAILNSASTLFLVAGYFFIRRRWVAWHRGAMLSAFTTSTLFLISYLVYHAQVGSKHFPGQGALRFLYLGILLTHSVLAALIVPLVLVTLRRAWRGDFQRHRRLARWTLPIWLYVSVTGVVVYWMLYRIY